MDRSFATLLAGLALAGCSDAPHPHGEERLGRSLAPISVEEAVDAGCSTSQVAGLSLQIIAQVSCNNPDVFAALPAAPNVSLGSAVLPYLQTPARDALESAIEDNPDLPLQINSMLRTPAQQLLLYRWFSTQSCGVFTASPPGAGSHEGGLAIDVQQYEAWQSPLEDAGFTWLGGGDPVSFDYAGMGVVDLDGEGVLAFQQLHNLNNPDDLITEDGLYGPQTEARLLAAPGEGYPEGATCGDLPMTGPSLSVSWAAAEDLFDDGVSAGVTDLFVGGEDELTITASGDLEGAELTIALPDELELVAVDGEVPSGSGSSVDVDLSGSMQEVTLRISVVEANVDDESPEPIELTVTGAPQTVVPVDLYERYAWRFESSRFEGWTSEDGDLEVDDGALVAEDAEHLESPELDLALALVGSLRLTLASPGGAELWWTTEEQPSFDASRSLALDVDAEARELTISGADLGAGQLTGLRIVGDGGLALDELVIDAPEGEAPPEASPPSEDEGCGCRTVGASGTGPHRGLVLLLLGAALAWLRRD